MSQKSSCFILQILQIDDLHKMNSLRSQLQQANKFIFNQEHAYPEVKNMIDNTNNLFQKQKLTKAEQNQQHLCLMKNFYRYFKWKFVSIFFLFLAQSLFKIPVVLLLFYIYRSVEDDNSAAAYMYLGLLSLSFVVQTVLCQRVQFRAQQLTTQMQQYYLKALLKEIINRKLIRRSQIPDFQLKLINKLDEAFKSKIKLIIKGFAIPFALGVLGCILVYIIGWFWLVGLGLIILVQLIQYHCFGCTQTQVQQAQLLKDKTQWLFLKAFSADKGVYMLNWAKVVQQTLLNLRALEFKRYLKYFLGTALRLTLNFGLPATFALVMLGLISKYASDKMNLIVINLAALYSIQFCFWTKEFSNALVQYFSVKRTFRIITDYISQSQEKCVLLNFCSQLKLVPLDNILQRESQTSSFVVLKDVSIYPEVHFLTEQIVTNVNLQIRAGDFLPIYIENQKDKDRFLKCLTLQAQVFQGSIEIKRQETLAALESFVLKGTLKQNIVMGRQIDQQKYNQILRVSNLYAQSQEYQTSTIDWTDQQGKQRHKALAAKISLARCLYSQRVIIVLDDIFKTLNSLEKIKLTEYLHQKSLVNTAVLLFFTDFQSSHCFAQLYAIQDKVLVKIRNPSFQNAQKRLSVGQLTTQTQIHQQKQNHQRKSEYPLLQREHHQSIQNFKKQLENCELPFWKTIFGYLFYNRTSKIVVTLVLLFHFMAQVALVVIIVYVTKYQQLKKGQLPFHTDLQYWLFLSSIALLIACLHFFRAFLLGYIVQKINASIFKLVVKYLFSNTLKRQQIFKNRTEASQFMVSLDYLNTHLFTFFTAFLSFSILAIVLLGAFTYFNPFLLIFHIVLVLPVYFWKEYTYLAIQFSKKVHFKHLKYVKYIFSHVTTTLLQIRVNSYEPNFIKQSNYAIDQCSKSLKIYLQLNRLYLSYSSYYCTCIVIASFFAILSVFKQAWIYQFTVVAVYMMDRITYFGSCFDQSNTFLKHIKSLSSLVEKVNKYSQKANLENQLYSQVQVKSSTQITEVLDSFKKKQAQERVCQKTINVIDKKVNFDLHLKKGEKIAIITENYHQIIDLVFGSQEHQSKQKKINLTIQGQPLNMFSLQQSLKVFSLIDLNADLVFQKIRANIDPSHLYSDQEITSLLKRIIPDSNLAAVQHEIQFLMKYSSKNLSLEQKFYVNLCRVMLQNKEAVVIVDEFYQKKGSNTAIFDKLLQLLSKKTLIFLFMNDRYTKILPFNRVYNLKTSQNDEDQSNLNDYT